MWQTCCPGRRCSNYNVCGPDNICEICLPNVKCGVDCCSPVQICDTDEKCKDCGLPFQPCCNDKKCDTALAVCTSAGVCQACVPGFHCGQTCCGPLETCVNAAEGKCVACGIPFQPCCPGKKCDRDLFCNSDGICQLCLNPCADTCCGPFESCQNGKCVADASKANPAPSPTPAACGASGQPCCAGGICAGDNICGAGSVCSACAPGRKCGNAVCCAEGQTCRNGACVANQPSASPTPAPPPRTAPAPSPAPAPLPEPAPLPLIGPAIGNGP